MDEKSYFCVFYLINNTNLIHFDTLIQNTNSIHVQIISVKSKIGNIAKSSKKKNREEKTVNEKQSKNL